MPDHEARLAALEAQLGQLTDACSRRRLDEHAGHIDETVVDAFFLLVAAVGVFSMQQGFAMLEVGSCAKDHTKESYLCGNQMSDAPRRNCVCSMAYRT